MRDKIILVLNSNAFSFHFKIKSLMNKTFFNKTKLDFQREGGRIYSTSIAEREIDK